MYICVQTTIASVYKQQFYQAIESASVTFVSCYMFCVAGELIPGHGIPPAPGAAVASAVVLPAPPPTAQPMGEAVISPHHHIPAEAGTVAVIGLQQPQQQPAPANNEGGAAAAATATSGNFWETVMVSVHWLIKSWCVVRVQLASLVIEKQRQRKGWAEEEAAEVTGKCNGMATKPFHWPHVFITGAEIKIYTFYY